MRRRSHGCTQNILKTSHSFQISTDTFTHATWLHVTARRKLVCLFLCLNVFSFFFLFIIEYTPLVFKKKKLLKMIIPLRYMNLLSKWATKIPSYASLIGMNTNYWVYNFAYKIIIEKQWLSLHSSFSSSTLFQTRMAPNFLQATWRIFFSKICLSVSTLKQHSDYKRNIGFSWHSYVPISNSFTTDVEHITDVRK